MNGTSATLACLNAGSIGFTRRAGATRITHRSVRDLLLTHPYAIPNMVGPHLLLTHPYAHPYAIPQCKSSMPFPCTIILCKSLFSLCNSPYLPNMMGSQIADNNALEGLLCAQMKPQTWVYCDSSYMLKALRFMVRAHGHAERMIVWAPKW